MSKTEQPVWSYGTQHVDVMLWQYCCGLFDLLRYIDRDKQPNVFEQRVAGKIDQLKAIYNIEPSFVVTLVEKGNGMHEFEMKKITVV
jgi:hypothetical protein